MDHPRNDRHRLDPLDSDSSDNEESCTAANVSLLAEDTDDGQASEEQLTPLQPYTLQVSSSITATHMYVAAHAALSPILLATGATTIGSVMDGDLLVGTLASTKHQLIVAIIPGLRAKHCYMLARSLLNLLSKPSQVLHIYTAIPQISLEQSYSTLSTSTSSNQSTLKVPAFLQGIEAALLALAEEVKLDATAYVFNQNPSRDGERSIDIRSAIQLVESETGDSLDLDTGRKAYQRLIKASKGRPPEMYS
ncbi:hypothetical protein BCR37DRAFT_392060 [Protomyces lactucae-debilis]|uniref:Proteasome assembly chaperone 1 n=1 Tax=Protomyces lactucae-debilis TaxID=2754530 RepID=A0A1Y2FKH5_PROLT|nr:uncharacterized protein BCR37DRAFT_392060 [Protomyces lactucae-debilis]ORY84491.1 hypothetical protein BCR37DRAFT_392060 [Protomyces lactucae-debilis]